MLGLVIGFWLHGLWFANRYRLLNADYADAVATTRPVNASLDTALRTLKERFGADAAQVYGYHPDFRFRRKYWGVGEVTEGLDPFDRPLNSSDTYQEQLSQHRAGNCFWVRLAEVEPTDDYRLIAGQRKFVGSCAFGMPEAKGYVALSWNDDPSQSLRSILAGLSGSVNNIGSLVASPLIDFESGEPLRFKLDQ